jgi:hypothetical protein
MDFRAHRADFPITKNAPLAPFWAPSSFTVGLLKGLNSLQGR